MAPVDEILWRRTKLGLYLTAEQQAAFTTWLDRHGAGALHRPDAKATG